MVKIPEEVLKLLNHPSSTKVVATKTPEGDVHAIVVGSVHAPKPDLVVFGTLIMKKTSENLRVMMKKGELASVLVVHGMTSFEIRVRIKEQRKTGKELEVMNEQLKPMGLNMSSAWYLEPVEVFDQSATYQAGTRVV